MQRRGQTPGGGERIDSVAEISANQMKNRAERNRVI
jgi:hypothetical protein